MHYNEHASIIPVTPLPGDIALPERMNFLGHLLVSGDDPLVITGNFMGDAVKGRDLSGYAPALRTGIRMHRSIDTYTDNHPLTLLGRERLRAHAGKYAGVALDMFYDHVLASAWERFHPEPLADFAARMYAVLESHAQLMPERTRRMLGYMVSNNWLVSYSGIAGIARALDALGSRVPGGERLIGSHAVLEQYLPEYRAEGEAFIHDLRQHLQHHG